MHMHGVYIGHTNASRDLAINYTPIGILGKTTNTTFSQREPQQIRRHWSPAARSVIKGVISLLAIAAIVILVWPVGFGYVCSETDVKHKDDPVKGELSLLSWRLWQCRKAGGSQHVFVVGLSVVITIELMVIHFILHRLARLKNTTVLPIIDVFVFAAGLGWAVLNFYTLVNDNMDGAETKSTLFIPWIRFLTTHNYGTVVLLTSLFALHTYFLCSYSDVEIYLHGMQSRIWSEMLHFASIIVYVVVLILFAAFWQRNNFWCAVFEYCAIAIMQILIVLCSFIYVDLPIEIKVESEQDNESQFHVTRFIRSLLKQTEVGNAFLILIACTLLGGAPGH